LDEVCPLCDGDPLWPSDGIVESSPELEALRDQMTRPFLSKGDDQLSVVSFNMLLKGFAGKHYYQLVGPELRAWPHRRKQLLELLKGVGADLYCMQEVECSSFEEERLFLEEIGYAAVAPKDDSKGKYPDMAKPAFFYRPEKLELRWADHRSRVVLACFEHLPSKKFIYAATCHLEGAPWEGEKRVAQTKKALESLQRKMLADKCKLDEAYLVFAGDFNEDERGAVCHLLSKGQLSNSFRSPDYPDMELTKSDISHNFALRNLYEGRNQATFCAPPCVTQPTFGFAIVDFLFYSQKSLRPLAMRESFTAEQTKMTCSNTSRVGIPAVWHFSDHVPIGGIFEFASNCSSPQGAPLM
jgi:mRNA deadenylase 3'-5' endonuclease subunit Ccr4